MRPGHGWERQRPGWPSGVLLLLATTLLGSDSMRVPRSWTEKHWCESIKEVEWPLAYQKYRGQVMEDKGRVNLNRQDMRHECNQFGVESKCHICEPIVDGTIQYQLQGVAWEAMSHNVPTVTDTPFAIGGSHRYDFGGNSSHVCVFLSGEHCIRPLVNGSSWGNRGFDNCTVRCWGYDQVHGFTGADNKPQHHLEANYYIDGEDNQDTYRTADGDSTLATDVWSYPKIDSSGVAAASKTRAGTDVYGQGAPDLTMNPQGYVYSLAGDGQAGYRDGPGQQARFRHPQDVAVDADGNVYVADTQNHCIRKVLANGTVSTVAGQCGPKGFGSEEGHALRDAQFSSPSGVTVYYDWLDRDPWTGVPRDFVGGDLVLFVADTDNHRIRRIDCVAGFQWNSAQGKDPCSPTVTCWAGRCGNGTYSYTLTKSPATPQPGYADGPRTIARFDSPRGIEADQDGTVYVADTNNHLIRGINGTAWVFTLAGRTEVGEADEFGEPLAGCPPPCLKGVPGWADGNLTTAEFYYPADVTMGGNFTLLVADKQRLRQVSFPEMYFHYFWHDDRGGQTSRRQGVGSAGRVATLAGMRHAGERDGSGPDAQFNAPEGVARTDDGIMYVIDSGSCRLRRVTPAEQVAEPITCFTTLSEIVRPSGCSSYDPPVDGRDMTVSPAYGNLYFNHDLLDSSNPVDGLEPRGRSIKDCVGVPPPDNLDKRFWNVTAENLVVDNGEVEVDEDTSDGTTIKVQCPLDCLEVTAGMATALLVRGNGVYSDDSSVCLAAQHSGALNGTAKELGVDNPLNHGLVDVTLEKGILSRNASLRLGSFRHGVQTGDAPYNAQRLFSTEVYPRAAVAVQSLAGHPAGLLERACGHADGQPMQEALFDTPQGIGVFVNQSLTDSLTLFIADTANHMIRGVSAGCAQICENGGTCVGPDNCTCAPGWTGYDCTLPVCSDGLCDSQREICVAPDVCTCVPGFDGPDCDEPQCVQECVHGSCSAPDTCSCSYGWWDANCTTPVCSQTCGNGGNCTGPDTCECPSIWTGPDCREPVCSQTCYNGGQCVAPDTCQCPPQWSGYDCAMPVCHQGYWEPYGGGGEPWTTATPAPTPYPLSTRTGGKNETNRPRFWKQYEQCIVSSWCNHTRGFDCAQRLVERITIEIPWGVNERNLTGRKTRPDLCTEIELGEDVFTYFQYLNADNSTTPYARYTPKQPYHWTADPRQKWSAFDRPVRGRTQPWYYAFDRQVAKVEYHNITQGEYRCANGGLCSAPDTCECADGWAGFDCRTPICNQGYYVPEQERFVRGSREPDDLENFEIYLEPRLEGQRLQWEYSNPNYTMHWEYFINKSARVSEVRQHGNERYLGPPGNSSRYYKGFQGGYQCSIRAVTQWERPGAPHGEPQEGFIHDHVNYYSRYQNQKTENDGNTYTFWEGMDWPPVHVKTAPLELTEAITDTSFYTYVYTSEGHRRDGIWEKTGRLWFKGTCIVEFNRTCENGGLYKDLESQLFGVLVQDTDLAFRPRVRYDYQRSRGEGAWLRHIHDQGECVDEVIRGCYNNGTCIAPDTCRCAPGWTGQNCTIPVCEQECLHNGNCTGPNECTCEAGWEGYDCRTPMCAQDCLNGGRCVAPDTCQCAQYDMEWFDNRDIPRPLYMRPNGDPQRTGFTGFDCSVPICVQATAFLKNADITENGYSGSGYREMGGRGASNDVACEDVRCPFYDEMVINNVGESFQGGCGFDPLFGTRFSTGEEGIGCCIKNRQGSYSCRYCSGNPIMIDGNTSAASPSNYTCDFGSDISILDLGITRDRDDCNNLDTCETYLEESIPDRFKISTPYGTSRIRICGPTSIQMTMETQLKPRPSTIAPHRNITSGSILCGVREWVQGDFKDDAGFNDDETAPKGLPLYGVGVEYGKDGEGQIPRFPKGRHVRANFNNITFNTATDEWEYQSVVRGEGVFECAHKGSCVGPDICSCKDGWTGFDCRSPLCRHLRANNDVAGCSNGGLCVSRDNCECITAESLLYTEHEDANRGTTGWMGTDCSMPICVQGYYDPFCTDLDQAPGGEGCYRCANGGNCTAPDFCQCAQGWTGYDCKTPVCEAVATPLARKQLNTLDEEKIHWYESDPCGMKLWREIGDESVRGVCTMPNQCTCSCWGRYDPHECANNERRCKGPWQDPMVWARNLLLPFQMFGTRACVKGYEGFTDQYDRFYTCHMSIFVPEWFEYHSVLLISLSSVFVFVFAFGYYYVRRKLKQRWLQAKIERRRSRRSSEESINKNKTAFAH